MAAITWNEISRQAYSIPGYGNLVAGAIALGSGLVCVAKSECWEPVIDNVTSAAESAHSWASATATSVGHAYLNEFVPARIRIAESQDETSTETPVDGSPTATESPEPIGAVMDKLVPSDLRVELGKDLVAALEALRKITETPERVPLLSPYDPGNRWRDDYYGPPY